jgi:hypothetical protein
MPITVTVDHAQRRVLARCEGVITYADVELHLQFEEQERGLTYQELFDARGATTNLTPEEIRRLVSRVQTLHRSQPDFGPTAIVADSDFMFGMARMFALLNDVTEGGTSGPAVEAFRDVYSAEQWLRVHATGSAGDSPP